MKVSVAASDVIYIYPELPPVFAIPQTPAHVLGVLNWQQSLVPVIDLGRHWGLQSEPNCAASQSVMVLLMLADTRLGAMALEQIPERVMVADSSQCELPASLEPWQALTASCFMDASHGAVPILDLNAVFGGG
ncbi:hypothetical protein A9Q89_01720 [Gammaproteobacteria bacterium 53_120_T64]|nr:hypothetical protein A9Q89_01720 [Gammaproteobacteria bacterium 53_120_T64]